MKYSLAWGSLAAALVACGDGGSVGAVDAGPVVPDAMIPPARGQFPPGFLWGTAVAPYQVEGGLHATDWYQWESHCDHCPAESADDGPEFWQRYEVDFQNARSLANNAIRLGIDWSRVFPTEQSFLALAPDADAVAGYHAMFAAARDRELNLMVTLHHFASPTWVQDLDNLAERRGWEDPQTIDRFAWFARWAGAEFGAEVDYWITINEPIPYVLGGWLAADTPPGKSFAVETAIDVVYHLMEGHAKAYDALHEADVVDADDDGVAAWVSFAQHSRVYLPKDPTDPDHVRAADMLRYVANRSFLDAVVHGNIDRNFDFDFDDPEDTAGDPALMGRLDFIGLNYYGVSLVIDTNENNFPLIGLPLLSDLDRQGFPGPMNDFGWTIYPTGFRAVIDEVVTYDRPILITENGIADATDAQRPRFVVDHLYALNLAIDEGVDVRGYYHWSLIDNFEWSAGFCPRFGLFRVDFDDPDKPRTMGEGAEVYRRIIDENTVAPDLFRTYPGYPGAEGFCPRLPL
jgi:beta-glucosidase